MKQTYRSLLAVAVLGVAVAQSAMAAPSSLEIPPPELAKASSACSASMAGKQRVGNLEWKEKNAKDELQTKRFTCDCAQTKGGKWAWVTKVDSQVLECFDTVEE